MLWRRFHFFWVFSLLWAPSIQAVSIITPRLLIRPIERGDWANFRRIHGDRAIQVQSNMRLSRIRQDSFNDAVHDTHEILRGNAASRNGLEFTSVLFLVFERETMDALGAMSFYRGGHSLYWESSTLLRPAIRGKPVWGRGFGTEARSAVTRFLFESLRIPGLISVVSSKNLPSLRVTQKLGFRYVRKVAARNGTIDFAATWHEYRLSAETYLAEKESWSGTQIAEDTRVVAAEAAVAPSTRQTARLYRALLQDGFLRSQFSPELLSVVAERRPLSKKGRLTGSWTNREPVWGRLPHSPLVWPA